MLSYQHAFHAGNLADLHKHGLLAWCLQYLTRKSKPVSYIETHAGRGHYDLSSAEAHKTGEATSGYLQHQRWFGEHHPLTQSVAALRITHGPNAYPGSPAIATHILRDTDSLFLAELHPTEYTELRRAFRSKARVYHQDGFALAHGVIPPTPRRGLALIDPPYEVKEDYAAIPRHIAKMHRAWNVGLIMLWYPILTSGNQAPMVQQLRKQHPDAMLHEVRFAPARPGHGMIGSGLFVLNPSFGMDKEAARLAACFAELPQP